MKYTLALAEGADESVRKAIVQLLVQFNEGEAGPSQHRTLALTIRDADHVVIGGLWGATAYGWMYTQMLAVPAALRGQGVGSALMRQAEREAWERGCRHAWVDTQFGARGFYERLGYASFGDLEDYPVGFTRVFLKKALG